MVADAGVALKGLPTLRFRRLPPGDVARAAEIETASYPADEAATPEKLEYRQRAAPELFYGVYEDQSLVAFIVSTAAEGEALSEESMSVHVPGGESICIHSVCVAASHRRRGIARAMVQTYVQAVAADAEGCGGAKRMLLIAHADLLHLYAQCGFQLLGPSPVEHGSNPWFDMRLDLAETRKLDMMQVDAFSAVPMAGNPAAILFTQRGGDEDWMQAVAAENNLAETAFLEERQAESSGGHPAWDIRWFTPTCEVGLCGHATLASAHALWESGRVPAGQTVVFHTRAAGTLTCSGDGAWIKMDFPAQVPAAVVEGAETRKAELAAALGLKVSDVLFIGKGPKTTPDWLLEVTPQAFASVELDEDALTKLHLDRGVIVTCTGEDTSESVLPAKKRPRILGKKAQQQQTPKFDFMSRFFAPAIGITEDPVTGSAHCVLAPYWTRRLQRPPGDSLRALQASGRGGLLRVRHLADAGRVELEGQAVTVLSGKFVA